MTTSISAAVRIAITVLQREAVGDTIEERFKNVIRPQAIRDACWMTTNEDEQFRAAIGAVMLSYGEGTPEFVRIEAEMKRLQQFSAYLSAATAGLTVDLPESINEGPEPIGLMGLWREREK